MTCGSRHAHFTRLHAFIDVDCAVDHVNAPCTALRCMRAHRLLLSNSGWFYAYNKPNPYRASGLAGDCAGAIANGHLDERFVAMDWCLSGMAVPTPDYVNQTFFMGFNEPNNLHNCNRDAETAAKYEKHAHTRPSTTAHTPQPSSHWHSASPTLRNSLFASLYLAPPLFDSSLPLVVFALVCVALTLCAPLRRKSCHVPRTVHRAWPTIVANHPHSMLVSPATAGNGVPWFDQFFGNCTKLYGKSGCNISYLAAHDYSCNPGEGNTLSRSSHALPIFFVSVCISLPLSNDHSCNLG